MKKNELIISPEEPIGVPAFEQDSPKSEIIPYRVSHLDTYLARIEDGQKSAITEYARKKAEYLKFREQNSQLEQELIAAGLNPNDAECLELICKNLTVANGGSGLSVATKEFSVAKEVIALSKSVYDKLITFRNRIQRLYQNYAESGVTMEFNNIVLVGNQGGDKKIILQELNPKKLFIRQDCFHGDWASRTEYHGVIDVKVYTPYFDPCKSMGRSCRHVGCSRIWRDFHIVARKYSNFYAQRSLSNEDGFPMLESYLNAYLEIPNILADKLGL